MLTLNIWASLGDLLIAAAIGLYIHYSRHPLFDDIEIPPWEYSFSTILLILLINPLVIWGGQHMAISHQTSYQEFRSGVELQPVITVYNCHESDVDGGSTGGCVHTRDVDSYTVQVWVDTSHNEGTGKDQHWVVSGYWKNETKYRQRPYTTTEITWTIPTTLEDVVVGPHWLPENPEAHRLPPPWGGDRNGYLPDDLPSGTPIPWAEADARVESGRPGPVSLEYTYTNWILASEQTLLKQYSGDIDRYQKLGLLPDINHGLYDFYFQDDVAFAGVSVKNPAQWQSDLANLNAVIGPNAQGRLYVVVVDANKISESDSTNYIMAVTAYWQSPKFAKYAISKNGIIVVLGTKDGSHVDWSAASTGMPRGNEAMLYDFRHNLGGTPLDPKVLLGDLTLKTTAAAAGYAVSAVGTQGAIGKIILEGADKFQRVSMSDYGYLKTDVILTTWEQVSILLVNFILSIGIWFGIAFYGVPAYQQWRGQRRR